MKNILLFSLMLLSIMLTGQSETKSDFTLKDISENPKDYESVCYSNGIDTLQGWKIHSYDLIEGYRFTIIDLEGNEVLGAFELNKQYCNEIMQVDWSPVCDTCTIGTPLTIDEPVEFFPVGVFETTHSYTWQPSGELDLNHPLVGCQGTWVPSTSLAGANIHFDFSSIPDCAIINSIDVSHIGNGPSGNVWGVFDSNLANQFIQEINGGTSTNNVWHVQNTSGSCIVYTNYTQTEFIGYPCGTPRPSSAEESIASVQGVMTGADIKNLVVRLMAINNSDFVDCQKIIVDYTIPEGCEVLDENGNPLGQTSKKLLNVQIDQSCSGALLVEIEQKPEECITTETISALCDDTNNDGIGDVLYYVQTLTCRIGLAIVEQEMNTLEDLVNFNSYTPINPTLNCDPNLLPPTEQKVFCDDGNNFHPFLQSSFTLGANNIIVNTTELDETTFYPVIGKGVVCPEGDFETICYLDKDGNPCEGYVDFNGGLIFNFDFKPVDGAVLAKSNLCNPSATLIDCTEEGELSCKNSDGGRIVGINIGDGYTITTLGSCGSFTQTFTYVTETQIEADVKAWLDLTMSGNWSVDFITATLGSTFIGAFDFGVSPSPCRLDQVTFLRVSDSNTSVFAPFSNECNILSNPEEMKAMFVIGKYDSLILEAQLQTNILLQELIDKDCCSSQSLVVSKELIERDCASGTIGENGNILSQHPNTYYEIINSSVSSGSGVNNGTGNRYTITISGNIPNRLELFVTPIGDLSGQLPNGVPNGLIPHIINTTANSVTYGLNSGDDGQGVDEFDRIDHMIVIKGCESEVVNDVQQN